MKRLLLLVCILSILVIVACSHKLDTSGDADTDSKNDNTMVELPNLNIEATIIEITLDDDEDNCERSQTCPGHEYPVDKGLIKITSIDATGDPQGRRNEKVGDEVNVVFRYSARPAKIIAEDDSTSTSDSEYSDTVVTGGGSNCLDEPIPFENGYFIYKCGRSNIEDIVLPGLNVGNKIKVNGFTNSIYKYEVI